MIVIKLGGSVITDKSRYREFRKELVGRLCREIKASGKDVMVVHGAGSFGHIVAKEGRLNDGFEDASQIPALAQTCYDTRDLSSMVVKELIDAGIPAVSVPTGSCFWMDDRVLKIQDDYVLRSMRDKGIMPVLFGDVVQDRKLGFAICSGDQIVERLADLFDAERVIFVSDVDGLYDSDPKSNPSAKLLDVVNRDSLENVSTDSSVSDVTGGVRSKIETMLRMCSGKRDCILMNGTKKGRLLSLLNGEAIPCTRAVGE